MQEILIYYPLYDFLTSGLIQELDTVNADYTVRMSSPGGEILSSWGVAKKVRELDEKGFKGTLKIDGMSASMAGVLAPFFENVEAVSQAKFLIHAPYGGDMDLLKSVANDLLDVFKARLDTDKFKEITGSTIEEIIDPESKTKRDVWLDADQALAIKLIDKVVQLTPVVKNEVETKMKTFYGFHEPTNNSDMAKNNENKFSFKTEEEFLDFVKNKFGLEPSAPVAETEKPEEEKFSFKTENAFVAFLKKTFNLSPTVDAGTPEAPAQTPAASTELTQAELDLKTKEEEITALNLQIENLKKAPGAPDTKPVVPTDGGGGGKNNSEFKIYASAKETWEAVAELFD